MSLPLVRFFALFLPVPVSQRASGDIATIVSFLLTLLDLYLKFPGTPETIKE